jgi:hypothetical protein
VGFFAAFDTTLYLSADGLKLLNASIAWLIER